MDELQDNAHGLAKKAPLARVISEQSLLRRHSSDGSMHRRGSHKSGSGPQEDDKAINKLPHRSSNDGARNGSPLTVSASQPQLNGSTAFASPSKPFRRSDSVKDMSSVSTVRESPSRLPRGFQLSLTDDQKKFINETIPRLLANDPSITTVITKGNLPSENYGDFAIAMVSNKKVNTLNMSECLYAIPVAVHVAKILHENRTLRELNANGNMLHTEGIKKIAPELSINNVLTRLYLRNNLISDEGAALIFANLQGNTTLQVLDLGKNDLSHQCLPALVTAMKSNYTLQEVVLDGTSVGDDGIILLAESFSPVQNTSLKSLSLQDAKIGPKGLAAFAGVMQSHKSLAKLLLRGNKIKVDRGAAESLFKLASLQKLDLSANSLGEEGVLMLAQGLLNNASLLHLNLSETLPTTTTTEPVNAIRSLAYALSKNSSLQTLMLVKNGLQDESIEVLMTALTPEKSALQAIDLSGNRITNKGAELIARMLSKNTHLHEIDLSSNRIMLAGAKMIIEALKQNRTMRKFIFINASIEPALPLAALEMLKQNFVLQKCLLQNKDEKKIASKIKKAMKVELAYNKKMNFYSYSVKYSRLFEKLSILQETKAANYVDFQQTVAEYFSQTRKIMRFLSKESASKNFNKQQVVKEIVKEDLARIFRLLNESYNVFKVYTDVTEKLQTTYEKLLREVPASAPEKPLIFPKPPVLTSTTNMSAAGAGESSIQHTINVAPNYVISPRLASISFGLLAKMDTLMVPVASTQSAAVDQISDVLQVVSFSADKANFVTSNPKEIAEQTLAAHSDNYQPNSQKQASVAAEPVSHSPLSDETSITPPTDNIVRNLANPDKEVFGVLGSKDDRDTHDDEHRLPNSRDEQQTREIVDVNAIPQSGADVIIAKAPDLALNNTQQDAFSAASRAEVKEDDSSDSSTSSSSSDSSDVSESSDVSSKSLLGDRFRSLSNLSSASNSRIRFTPADPSVVPPLKLPNSDDESKNKQKTRTSSAAAALPSTSIQAAAPLMLFKPTTQKDKSKVQDEYNLDQLKELAMDFLVRFMGQLMASIVNKNVINNEDKVFLRGFEKQMGIFLCKLFDEFKGQDVPETSIRKFIASYKNFTLEDEHIRDLVSILEIVNAQRFSLLSSQSRQLLQRIFDEAIIESLQRENAEDLEIVQRMGEREDPASERTPRHRLIFFNYLKVIIFEHTLHLFSKTQQWANGGKASAKSSPLPLSPPPEPPKEKDGCLIC